MAVLRISLLGPFQVWLNEIPVIHYESNKVRALLSYLAAEPDRQHCREHLADLLWPAYTHPSALTNLRFTISSLQKTLNNAETGCLNVWRDSLQFNTSAQAAIDTWEFSNLLRLSRAQAPSIHSLEQAVSLYRGVFLEGFSIPDCAPFEEWLLLKREQYTRMVLKALNFLAETYELRGDFESAQQYAWRQVEIEPWLEEGYQQLMRALALGGQRSAALVQFDTCRKLMDRELGIEPGRETQIIYEAICKDDLESLRSTRNRLRQLPSESKRSPSKPAPGHHHPAPPLPFVGYQAELTCLGTCLAESMDQAGRVVFISGDFGSGKTALAQEFTCRALSLHPELVAAWGACSAALGFSDSCLAFSDILQMLTGNYGSLSPAGANFSQLTSRLEALLPHTLHLLCEQGAELVGRFLSPEPLLEKARAIDSQLAEGVHAAIIQSSPGRSHSDIAQEVIFEQLTHLICALSDCAPLLLILDDMQWADSGTTSLLFHLGRRIHDYRVLILVLYRPGDLFSPDTESWQPLERIIDELLATPAGLALDLDHACKRSFIDAYLDLAPNACPASFRERLFHVTQGNPLYACELLRGLQERGELQIDAAGAWIPGAALDWSILPPRLEALIAGRMHRLPEPWLRLLQAASIEGEQFTAELAAQLIGLDSLSAVHWLGGPLCRGMRLVQHIGFERPQGQSMSRYRFVIPLYQIYLYNQMDESERASLHDQAARILESQFKTPPAGIARQIAWHYQRAHYS